MEIGVWSPKPHIFGESPYFPDMPLSPGLRAATRIDESFTEGGSGGTPEGYVPISLPTESYEHYFSTGYSRQQCSDFEERGFCLLGDSCPMEHGANKIVVEDVQSLYRYNFQFKDSSPVSEFGEVTSQSSSGVHSLCGGGGGECDSYDPDYPLLSDSCVKMASPSYPPHLPEGSDGLHPIIGEDNPPSAGVSSSSHGNIKYPGSTVAVRAQKPPFRSGRTTIYVGRIPSKDKKRDALLSHFSCFGRVSGIHIPLGRDEAFVRFSEREDAEAALRAPDAVMGNRFIVLRWAKHDCFPNIDVGPAPAHEKPGNLISLREIQKKLQLLEEQRTKFIDRVTQFEKAAAARGDEQGIKKQKKEMKTEEQKESCDMDTPLEYAAHPTSFTIMPPFPPGFSDVTILEKHFSRFGDLSRVELDHDRDFTGSLSAHVTFKSRSAAERAFVSGCSWNGHKLRFMWRMPVWRCPGSRDSGF